MGVLASVADTEVSLRSCTVEMLKTLVRNLILTLTLTLVLAYSGPALALAVDLSLTLTNPNPNLT